jgi:transposase
MDSARAEPHIPRAMKTYRRYEPKQAFLLPPSPSEWLPEDHLAYFLLDVIDQLDLSAITAHYERELRGFPPHHPRMMVALLLYAYCVGIPSSRQIEKKTHEDVAFRVLAADNHPDHKCISEFRRIHLERIAALFVQVLGICRKAGLVKLGHVALDGTKIKANASKHKAMSHARMREEERRLKVQVDALLAAAARADATEDATYGADKRGDEVPAELRRAEQRLKRIREAKAALEAEAKAVAEAEAKTASDEDDDDDGGGGGGGSGGASGGGGAGGEELPAHRVPITKQGAPKDEAQRNFTDPDSRIMVGGDGFVQAYNAQIVVDDAHQIIVAHGVSNQPPDAEYFAPMLARAHDHCGRAPDVISADNGYWSERNVDFAEAHCAEPLIAPGRRAHREHWDDVRRRLPLGATPRRRMAERLATPEAAALYRRRKVIVEPVFGQIKQARGFRRMSMRGVAKARGEWALVCLTHNLLKLHRART